MLVRVAGIYEYWLTLRAYQKLSFWMKISKLSRKYSASQLGNHGDVRPCRNTSAMGWKWVAVGVRRTHRWERKKIQIIPVQAKRPGNLLFWRFLNSFISCVASPCEPGQGHPDSNHCLVSKTTETESCHVRGRKGTNHALRSWQLWVDVFGEHMIFFFRRGLTVSIFLTIIKDKELNHLEGLKMWTTEVLSKSCSTDFSQNTKSFQL